MAVALAAAALVGPSAAHAQSFGRSVDEIAGALRRTFGRVRCSPSRTTADGVSHRTCVARRRMLFDFSGPAVAPFAVGVILPARSDAMRVLGGLLAVTCPACAQAVGDIGAWIVSVPSDTGLHARRYGDRTVTLAVTGAPRVYAITIDARPPTDAPSPSMSGEQAALEAERARRAGELLTTVRALPVDATVDRVREVRVLIDRDELVLPSDRAVLREELATLLLRQVQSTLDRARADLRAGNLDAAGATLDPVAAALASIREAVSAGTDEEARAVESLRADLRRARIRRLVLEAQRAEQTADYRAARRLFGDAMALAEGAEGTGAEEGLRRSEGRRLSGGSAFLLSLVPGGGQLYTRRPGAALGFLLGTAAAVAGGIALVSAADERYGQYLSATDGARATDLYEQTTTLWALGLTSLGVAAGIYIWNLIDAPRGAGAWNREHLGAE